LQKKRVLVLKVIESHYSLKTLVENNNKGSTNAEKNLKQKDAELSLRTVLEGLANADLKVLKNWIPKNKDDKVKIEMFKLNLDNGFDIEKESLPDCQKVKENKTPKEYLKLVKSNNLNSQFDPGRLFCQYEISLGKVYKVWKKKVKKLKKITENLRAKI
ncbi:43906_t:CDS:2, partial [Gigaspora margarita]